MRVETFANCTLYLGDVREIVPGLEQKHRLAVSDVPYKLTAGGVPKAGGPHKVMNGGWMGGYAIDGKPVQCDITWDEIFDVLSAALEPDAEAYVMANDKNVIPAGIAAGAAGLKTHNILAWDKGTATANRWFMKNLEFTLFFYRGRARAIADCSLNQLAPIRHKDATDHPTEKPVALMALYVGASARAGEAVIDPFMGSGTTGLACLKTGNPFTGIEIDEKHFDTACRRHERALEELQADPDSPNVLWKQRSFLADDAAMVPSLL